MLKRIKIENFKSFENFIIDIPQFTAIVGNNAVGKSNLLRAINLISLLASGIQIKEAFVRLDLLNKEIFFNSSNPKFSFSLDLEIHGVQINYSFEIEAFLEQGNNFNYRVTHETLNNGKQIINRQGDKIFINYDESEGNSPSKVDVDLVSSQIVVSLITKPKIVAEVRKFISLIKVDVFEPSKLRDPGSLTNVVPGLNKNLAENLYWLKNNRTNLYGEIEKESKEIINGLENIDIDIIGGNLVVSFKETSVQDKLTVFSSSDGNVRAVGILAAILGEPRPSVIFIDEIENSMHPRRIKALMKFLNYLSEKEYGGVQILLTTHSPVVLRCIDERQIIYMFKENGKTTISKPYENKKVHEYLHRALNEGNGNDIGDLFESGALEEIYRLGLKKNENGVS